MSAEVSPVKDGPVGARFWCVHAAFLEQRSQPQPSWWLLVLIHLVVAHGVTLLAALAHALKFSIAMWMLFGLQVLIAACCAVYLLIKYRLALLGRPAGVRRSLLRTSGMIALLSVPTLVYGTATVSVTARSLRFLDESIDDFSALAKSPELAADRRAKADEIVADSRRSLRMLYDAAWSRNPWGPGVVGVICAVIASLLLAPIVEELIFSGLALNLLYKRMRLPFALAAVCILFTLSHVPAFGFGAHLIPVALLSLLAAGARVLTGTWTSAVAVHLVINICAFLPKLMIAAAAFGHGVATP